MNQYPDLPSSWLPITRERIRAGGLPPKFLIDGFLEEKSLSIFFGAPGCFKSMIVLDMCHAISAGQPWLANGETFSGLSTEPCNILYFDHDMGEDEIIRRVYAMENARGMSSSKIITVSNPAARFDASNDRQVYAMERMIKDEGAKLVVFDNLSLISGEVKENDIEMRDVMSNLRSLTISSGAAILPIHHQRKGDSNGHAGDALRGHSSIEASLNLAIHVRRRNGTNRIRLDPVKVRGAFIGCTISAEFETTSTMPFQMETAIFSGIAAEKKEVRKTVDLKRVITEIVQQNSGRNKKDVVSLVYNYLSDMGEGVGITKIDAEVKAMAESGQLVYERGSKNAMLLTVPAK